MEAASFGYKTAWLALRTHAPDRVGDALGLMEITAVPAESGIRRATAKKDSRDPNWVFVSEPVDDWVLAMGDALFRFAEQEPPDFGSLISRLSEELQCEVQFFCTHRVIEAHGWGRARRGDLRRAYLFLGEAGRKMVDLGDKSAEEGDLGFAFFDPSAPEAAGDSYWDREDLRYPDESDVLRLASRWSIDPSEVDGLRRAGWGD